MARYQAMQLEQVGASGAYGTPNTWSVIDSEIFTRDGKPFIWKTFANQALAVAAATAQNSAVTATGHADIKGLHP